MGANRSMSRVLTVPRAVLNLKRSCGNSGVNVQQGVVFLSHAWRTNACHDSVSRLEPKLLQLLRRDVHVVGRIQVVVIGRTKERVAFLLHFNHAFRLHQSVEVKSVLLGF